MKRLIGLAVIVAALSMSSVAFANSSPIAGDANGIGTSQGGKNMQTTQYRATYTDAFFGPVSCTGVHQQGKNTPALGRDSFTCTSTVGGLSNVTPGQSLTLSNIGGWFSDYYNQLAQFVLATSFSATVSLDGMSYDAVASY
jgi:hypothetical protein